MSFLMMLLLQLDWPQQEIDMLDEMDTNALEIVWNMPLYTAIFQFCGPAIKQTDRFDEFVAQYSEDLAFSEKIYAEYMRHLAKIDPAQVEEVISTNKANLAATIEKNRALYSDANGSPKVARCERYYQLFADPNSSVHTHLKDEALWLRQNRQEIERLLIKLKNETQETQTAQ